MNSQQLIANSGPVFLCRRLEDGTMEEISANNPLPVSGGGADGFLGLVGGPAFPFTAPLVTTAGPYSANDYVGGLITLTDAARVAGGAVLLQSVSIQVKSLQTGALKLVIFNANPTATTIANNEPFSINAADVFKSKVALPITQVTALSASACLYELDNIARMFTPAAGRNLYAALVTNTAWTLGSIADVSVDFEMFQVN